MRSTGRRPNRCGTGWRRRRSIQRGSTSWRSGPRWSKCWCASRRAATRPSHARHLSYRREPMARSVVDTGMKQLQRVIDFLFNPPLAAPRSTLIMRLMVGDVFLSEGILKFVYTNQGVGRFAKLGIPAPELTATFVGSLEIVGGILLMAGLLTRVIAIPFIIEMVVAILTTKISLYLGTSPLPLPPAPPKVGFWAVMHETRSDYAQILTSIFLLVVGPGPWSLDALLHRHGEAPVARQGSEELRLLPGQQTQ